MKGISIKRDIYLYLFGLAISLIAIYSLMINQSYNVGLNESAKYAFMYEVSLVEQEFLATGEVPRRADSSTFQVFTDYDSLPAYIRDNFDWERFEEDVIYDSYLLATPDKAAQYLFASYHMLKGSDITLFLVSEYDEDLYYALLEADPPESINTFNTIVGGILMLLVFLIIRLLIHRLTKPVLSLANWAESLDLKDTSQIENLRYSEINLLSQQLVSSIEKQREVIEREEFFLRAASHEMRTPIAVISASSEMLERVKGDLPGSSQRAISRINRSVTGIQGLMTTLLWLSREKSEDLATKDIPLHDLVEGIIEEHSYLIKNKELDIAIEGRGTLSDQVEILVRIVFMNLIRNAIQHTDGGRISVRLDETGVVIENPFSVTNDKQGSDVYNTSFGVGLFLVEKICHKQGWQFKPVQEKDRFMVSVRF
ncbi:HAMP domain-containing histidine kinase [Vibrio sp. JC009]|uniref:sensor histidine kinase n=1 Tax=Vibrio sp. JC009 TaxID=2912314 RepID=UPI0023B0D520|nr:HAMP domain-containing sensor histidine kinase [Vibrio sp. JC009]WED24401.1 HAMP domain-containing histidine kinase [Vibrio sp. JC009]